MKKISEILDAVANGKMQSDEARKQIEKLYERKSRNSEAESPVLKKAQPNASRKMAPESESAEESVQPDSMESFKHAFEKLKKSVNIDELIKISSGVVQQIAESMPNQLERIQENIGHYTVGFSSHTRGVDSKLSIFRTFHTSDDSIVEDNQVVGSQWFGVSFADAAEIKKNKFTAVQFSEVGITRSNLCSCFLALTRFSNVTMQEARFEHNKVSRTTFSDVSFTESDFTLNKLSKSEFAQTVVNASRLSGNSFTGIDMRDCEFDSCDIQGIEFENCTFHECSFQNVVVECKETFKISNQTFVGQLVQNCLTVAEFVDALMAKKEASETAACEHDHHTDAETDCDASEAEPVRFQETKESTLPPRRAFQAQRFSEPKERSYKATAHVEKSEKGEFAPERDEREEKHFSSDERKDRHNSRKNTRHPTRGEP
jgi:hypothetical protein